MSSFIVGFILVILVIACVYIMVKDHRNGTGCSDCAGCSKAKQCTRNRGK